MKDYNFFMVNLEDKLARLPEGPGVYFMKGTGGVFLYIGKAKNLSDRVRSYFQKGSALTPRISHMVDLVRDIETMVTGSDLEALILENNLIKKHRPRFNVVLRDDKNYPYLRLAIHDDFPRPEIVRRVRPDGALYYGPYVPTHALRETLRVLRKIFPLPNCNIVIDGKAERPCIEFEIKRCLAPCTGYQSLRDYKEMIRHLKMFLEGKDKELIKTLRSEMRAHSDALQYEEAARLRDQIAKIERTLEIQRVTSTDQSDLDVVGVARSGDQLDLQVLFIRGGMLTGRKNFFMGKMDDADDQEVITGFLQQFYNKDMAVPPEVVLPAMPLDSLLIEEWLSDRRGGPVHLSAPGIPSKKGRKSTSRIQAIIDLAQQNAAASLEGYLAEQNLGGLALEELKKILGLKRLPQRIEAIDISNIMGSLAVGSVVVFDGGNPLKADYRHFRIRTIQGANDFGMIQEVIQRHYSGRISQKQTLPDLILIDGGRGQLSSALTVLHQLGIRDRDVIGLAKTKGEKFERVYLPKSPNPVGLDPASPATHLLQRVRDEAHRFAITYHRKLRSKGLALSELNDIPGIGSAKKKGLLKRFGSLDEIRQASFEELMEVSGITKKLAERILLALHRETATSEVGPL